MRIDDREVAVPGGRVRRTDQVAAEFEAVAIPRRIASDVGGPMQMVILDGCGHVPHCEQPGRVLDLVVSFLRDAIQ